MTQLHDLDATDQAAALRAREVSSLELVQHHLDRIDAHSEALGAFITVMPEIAMKEAAAADALFASGVDKGPLQAMPLRSPECRSPSRTSPSPVTCRPRWVRP